MYLKTLLDKVSETISYEIKSAVFYSVLKDELKSIYDHKERVLGILNKNSFLFIMEKEKDVSEKNINFPVSFYSYDEDLTSDFDFIEDLSCFKVASYPRLFSFEHNEKINKISQ
jgi:hypothetical protein